MMKGFEDINAMKRRHQEEVKELQNNCKHKKSSRMPYMWAPGHFSNDIEVCIWCGKILKTYGEQTAILPSDVKITY